MFALDGHDKITVGSLSVLNPDSILVYIFFAYRTVKIWNKLKTKTVSALIITGF